MALSRNYVIQVASAAKETAYDTAATIDNRINVNIGGIPREVSQVVSDDDKVGGFEEATDAVVFARHVTYDLGINRVKPFALGHFGAFGLGAVASAVADTGTPAITVKQHACTPVANDGALNSFTFEELKTSEVKNKFSGGLVNTLNLSVTRGANRMVNMTAGIIASGTVATGGAAVTEPAETQLNASTAGVWLVPDALNVDYATAANRTQNLDTTVYNLSGAVVDLKDLLRSVTWDFSNNISPDDLYRVGGGLFLAVGQRSGRTQTLQLDFDYEGGSGEKQDAYVDALQSQTEYSFQMIVRGAEGSDENYYHGFSLIFPVMQLIDVEIADDGGTLVNRTNWQIMDDDSSVHKSVYLDVFNEEAAYMA